jgi:hypothetical protein
MRYGASVVWRSQNGRAMTDFTFCLKDLRLRLEDSVMKEILAGSIAIELLLTPGVAASG